MALLGTDIERIVSGAEMLHEVWAPLLDVVVATYLLERKLSLACLAPVSLVLVFILATGKLSAAANTTQIRWIEKVQQRLRATSYVLDRMKSVKISGLTSMMTSTIKALRSSEIAASEGYRKVLVVMLLLSNTSIILAPMGTFGLYVAISLYWKGSPLEVSQAFTSLALISLLAEPIVIFTQALPSVIECLGCFDRIEQYCSYAAVDHSLTPVSTHYPTQAVTQQHKEATAIELLPARSQQDITFSHANFSYGRGKTPVLRNVSVSIRSLSVTVVVGPVGSGKSSLLRALLGELVTSPEDGRPQVIRAAYCAQEPWLEDRTIRETIVSVNAYDEKWYNTVVNACALAHDLEHLPQGDASRTGGGGINLSGGQRQRVALARAVYTGKKTLLLDDVFSGIDVRTAKEVSKRLLGDNGLLRAHGTTVVLATSNRSLTRFADNILSITDGCVTETSVDRLEPIASLRLDEDNISPLAGDELHEEVSGVTQGQASPGEACNIDAMVGDLRRKEGDSSVYRYYLASSGMVAVGGYLAFVAL